MTAKARRTTKPAQRPVPDPTQLEEKPAQVPAVVEPEPTAQAEPPAEEQAPAEQTEQEPRRPNSRVEVVVVGECKVSGCPVLEFEPGRGLCMGHFTTRLDLREAARHG